MHSDHKQYWRLLAMAVLHFIAMYVLMYAMVDAVSHIHPNLNQFYMAALMTAPMLILEVWLMSSMYPKRAVNGVIVVAGLFLLVSSFLLIRYQTGISDVQFLKSMIPHHSGAILMCGHAQLRDEQVQQLCANIAAGQQAEIDWMHAKLKSLGE